MRRQTRAYLATLARRVELTDQYEYDEQSDQIRLLKSKEHDLLLELAISMADLMNCVNLMPKGFLWAQTFSQWKSGAYGIVASGLAFYKLCRQMKPSPVPPAKMRANNTM